MSPKTENRPREVTWGAIAVVILGVLVIARAFDALGGLESLETQKALRSALDSDSARELGVTVGALTDVLHAVILIGGAATAVSIVTALYAVRGHRSARWGLLASGLVGGVGALMFDPAFGICLAVAAVVATVSRRAAIWFDGGTPPPAGHGRDQARDRGRPPARPDHRPTPPAHPDADRPPDREEEAGSDDRERRVPPPTEDFGRYRPPPAAATAQPGRVRAPVERPGTLPGSARVAVLVAWGACLGVLVAAVGAMAALADDRGPMVAWAVHWLDLEQASVSDAEVATGIGVALVLVAVWAVLAIVVATWVRRGSATARMLLVMDAVVAVAGALALLTSGDISALAQLVGSVVLLAGTASAVLLLSPSSAAYFGDHQPPGDQPRPGSSADKPDEDRLPHTW